MSVLMGSSITNFAGSTVTVALIVIATRWLIGANGPQLPKTCGGITVYGVKPAWRALGFVVEFFSVFVIIWSWYGLRHLDWILAAIFVPVGLLGLTISMGTVTTDQAGITYSFLWQSHRFLWKEVTEIRLHKRDGGAIELRSGPRKLTADSRFIARAHLLNEIQNQTGLQPLNLSS